MQNLTSIFSNFNEEFFYATCTLTIIWYTYILFKKHSPRPSQPPGPRGLPLVGSLPFLDPELHTYFAKLATKYGPILSLRLGGELGVVVSSPATAREVLKGNDVVFANRPVPAVVAAMEYGGRDIVFTPHGPEWRMLRKACVRDMLGHTTLDLDAFYRHRRHEVRGMVRRLYGGGFGVGAVNVGEMMFSGVLNVITSMLWGGVIGGDEGAEVGAEFRRVVGEITELLGKPNVSDFFPKLSWMDLQGLKRQMKKVIVKLEGVFEKIIEEQMREEGSKRGNGATNFLQVLLQLKEGGETEIPLTMMHIKALLVDMVVGGTDTTSSTVEFAMAEMMNKPEVMQRAQQELDVVVGNRAVEESDSNNLPYLSAVIKEVLRLHPVLPLMVPHCPSEPCLVGGYIVPKGARTFVNVWAIHRDPLNWTNPNEFLPERFLNGDDRKGDSSNDFSYLPFGSGRRSCAGIAMADRIVMYSLATLVHSFSWNMGEGETLDLEEKFGIVLKKKVPLVAIPTPRLSEAKAYV